MHTSGCFSSIPNLPALAGSGLVELIDGFLDSVIDVIQYGPLDAIDIATSPCPGAERMCREITGESISKALEPLSTSSMITEGKNVSAIVVDTGSKNADSGIVLEESEEEMINNAIAEKGHW